MTARCRVLTTLAAIVMIAAGCGSGSDVQADAGNDFSIAVGESPQFDGCGSEGDIASYQWTIREAPSGMADDVDKVLRELGGDCSFDLGTAMIVDEVGDWSIELEVNDLEGNSSNDTVVVTVTG